MTVEIDGGGTGGGDAVVVAVTLVTGVSGEARDSGQPVIDGPTGKASTVLAFVIEGDGVVRVFADGESMEMAALIAKAMSVHRTANTNNANSTQGRDGLTHAAHRLSLDRQ